MSKKLNQTIERLLDIIKLLTSDMSADVPSPLDQTVNHSTSVALQPPTVYYRVSPGQPALNWAKRMNSTYGFDFDPNKSDSMSALIWPLPTTNVSDMERKFEKDHIKFKKINMIDGESKR